MKENVKYDKKSIKLVEGKTANFGELAKDCVAFANASGGCIDIGIEDNMDLPDANQRISEGLSEKIVKRLNENTYHVAVNAEVLTAQNGGQYIKLHILPSCASIACTTKGQFFIRDNDSRRPLVSDDLNRLFSDKPSYNWETKVSMNILWKDCEESKLRDFILDIKKSDRVSDFVKEKTKEELLSYYQMVDAKGYLTNLGVLWIGTAAQRARLLYAPIVQYIKYDALENKVSKKVWDDYRLNPKELIQSIWESIPDWKETNEVSEGLWRKEIPVYDEKVVRELLCNAIAHRPYTTRGDIFIQLYPDKMSITNPGFLPLGVTVNNILQKTQKRNVHLAKVFYDLRLMEAEGSGYDLMYETLLTAGKDKPNVVEGDDFVQVEVYRTIITKDAARLIDYISDNFKLNRKAYIALGIILKERTLSAIKLADELQLGIDERLRSYVDLLIKNKIIISSGKGKSTKYSINPAFITNSKLQIPTTLKTIEPYRLKALICEDLKFHPKSLLSEMASRLPDVDFTQLESTVRSMAKTGELLALGGRKFRRYNLP